MAKVGTVVRLKIPCLKNPEGTLGVCFNKWEDIAQFIFENGEYDGFDEIGQDRYLEEIGFCDAVADYEFKNVIQVGCDYDAGKFTPAFVIKEEN